MIVSDIGTELTSVMGGRSKVGWHYIAPGKPVKNASPSHSSAA